MSQQEAAALTAGPIAKANAMRQKGNKAFVEGGRLWVGQRITVFVESCAHR
jgi:hypothetical protein